MKDCMAKKDNLVVFLDCLLLESFIRLILICILKMTRIDVYYLSHGCGLKYIKKICDFISIIRVREVEYDSREMRLEGWSLHELSNYQTKELANNITNDKFYLSIIGKCFDFNVNDAHKVKSYYKIKIFEICHKVVVLNIMAKFHSKITSNGYLLLIKHSGLLKEVHKYLDCEKMTSYRIFGLRFRNISSKYYIHLSQYYRETNIFSCLKNIVVQYKKFIFQLTYFTDKNVLEKIAIEFTQKSINENACSDFFPLFNSRFNKKNVMLIENGCKRYFKSEQDFIKNKIGSKIHLGGFFGLIRNKKIKKFMLCFIKKELYMFFIKIMLGVIRSLIFSLRKNNFSRWVHYESALYHTDLLLWDFLIKRNKVKILFTMFEGGAEKTIISDAMNMNEGIMIGVYRSYYPLPYGNIFRAYDIIFTWGRESEENGFIDHSAIFFQAGFPFSYYFKHQQNIAKQMQCSFNNFKITFFDNAYLDDIYPLSSQLLIYDMLLDLLSKYDDMILYWKPKRQQNIEKIIRERPQIRVYIEEKRVIVKCEDECGLKVPSVLFGYMSDMVIGIGISSAAIEAAYGGALPMFFDNTLTHKNKILASKLKGKFLFDNISNFRATIISCMEVNKRNYLYSEYKKISSYIDSFQDDEGHLRITDALNYILEGYKMKKSKETLLKDTEVWYNNKYICEKSVMIE